MGYSNLRSSITVAGCTAEIEYEPFSRGDGEQPSEGGEFSIDGPWIVEDIGALREELEMLDVWPEMLRAFGPTEGQPLSEGAAIFFSELFEAEIQRALALELDSIA